MPNSAATSVAALPLLSQSSTACCLKVLSNFFRVFLHWITGAFIVALSFYVSLYLCPFFRAGPHRGEGERLRLGLRAENSHFPPPISNNGSNASAISNRHSAL